MVKLTHYAIHRRGKEGALRLDPLGDIPLEAPSGQGSGKAHNKEEILLSELVDQLNMIFEDEHTDNDMINYAEGVRDKVMEDTEVTLQAINNTSIDQFANGKRGCQVNCGNSPHYTYPSSRFSKLMTS